jgi:hypothetical protein
MQLTAEQIHQNWVDFIGFIDGHISEPRKTALKAFYEKYEDRIILMPAAHKKEYHNAFPGGYVEHVNRVVTCAIHLHKLWGQMGADLTTFTKEELVFSALNHDLGKMGSETEESYIPQTDRGLFLLQAHDIKYTFNEMVAIQTHDGLYDDANKKYLMTYMPEQKPRTSLPFIVHQADLMAARIEFEREWLPKLNGSVETKKTSFTLEANKKQPSKDSKQTKALGSLKNEGLKNLLDNL